MMRGTFQMRILSNSPQNSTGSPRKRVWSSPPTTRTFPSVNWCGPAGVACVSRAPLA